MPRRWTSVRGQRSNRRMKLRPRAVWPRQLDFILRRRFRATEEERHPHYRYTDSSAAVMHSCRVLSMPTSRRLKPSVESSVAPIRPSSGVK
jgi:hypothetical protein